MFLNYKAFGRRAVSTQYLYIYSIYIYMWPRAGLYVRTVSWGHKVSHWAIMGTALMGQALMGPPGPSWAGP